MKKDVKALIKRLTLLIQFTKAGKGWIGIDGDGATRVYGNRPVFHPSGESESLDYWVRDQKSAVMWISDLDNMPLSMVCPSLTSKEALFYTDGETVWLIDQ